MTKKCQGNLWNFSEEDSVGTKFLFYMTKFDSANGFASLSKMLVETHPNWKTL